MAKGTQYSKQFKEDAVRYRKDHPELTVQKAAENLGISESALKNWMKAAEKMKVLSPHAEQVIIPVMKPKKLPVLKENCEILRMPLKY